MKYLETFSLANGTFAVTFIAPPRRLRLQHPTRRDERVQVPRVVLGGFHRLAVPVERFLNKHPDAHVAVLLGALEEIARLF